MINYFFLLYVCFVDLEKIKAYIDSFRFGAPPHAGGGIGNIPLYDDNISNPNFIWQSVSSVLNVLSIRLQKVNFVFCYYLQISL